MEIMKQLREFLKTLPSNTCVVSVCKTELPSLTYKQTIDEVLSLSEKLNSDHRIILFSEDNSFPVEKRLHYLNLQYPNVNFMVSNSIKEISNYLKFKYKDTEFVKEISESQDYIFALAEDNDIENIKNYLPENMRLYDIKRLVNDIRICKGLEPIREELNINISSLREDYHKGKIYNIGDCIKSDNKVYEIVKRGSNYLSVVDENGNKYKKWLHDCTPHKGKLHRDYVIEDNLLIFKGISVKEDLHIIKLLENIFYKYSDKDPDALLELIKSINSVNESNSIKDLNKVKSWLNRLNEEDSFKEYIREKEMTIDVETIKENEKVDTKSKYNIAKDILRFKDFVKLNSMNSGKQDMKYHDNTNTAVHTGNKVGITLAPEGDDNHRKMKVKYKTED